MVAGVTVLVYFTGGVKYVYSHAMYLPIIVAGFRFGLVGGLLTAIVAGGVPGAFHAPDRHPL